MTDPNTRAAVVNLPKLVVVVLLLACSTLLVVLGRLDTATWVAITGPFVGIAIGNGINVARGQSPAPMIDTTDRARRVDDSAGG